MKPETPDYQEGSFYAPNGVAWLTYESSGDLVDSTPNAIPGDIDPGHHLYEISPFGEYCLFFDNAVGDEGTIFFYDEFETSYSSTPNYWVAFWMKPATQYATRAYIFQNQDGSGLSISDDKLDFWTGDTSDNFSSVDISYGVWQHVVVSCTAGIVKLYLNAVVVGTFDFSTEIVDFWLAYIGNSFAGEGYVGRIDSFLVNKESGLTDGQVEILYEDHWRGFHIPLNEYTVEDDLTIVEELFRGTHYNLSITDTLTATDLEAFYLDPITVTEATITVTEVFEFNWIYTEDISDTESVTETIICLFTPRIYERLIQDRLTIFESIHLNKNLSLIISDQLNPDDLRGGTIFLNYIDSLNVPSLIGAFNGDLTL